MMSVLWIFMLIIAVLIWKTVVSVITKYNTFRSKFSNVYYDSADKKADKYSEVIEMVKKEGVWEIPTNVKGP
jgi:hypothetical protein